MSTSNSVVGVFSYADTTKAAIEKLKSEGVKDFTLHMPTYVHELAHAKDDTDSPVRFVTLLGGITGLACGVLMTGWMSQDWPLRVSMKPVYSWPAFTVIMFELTILIGGLSNLLAMFGLTKLPKLSLGKTFDPRFTDDKFGIVVPVQDAQKDTIQRWLETSGAEEVRHVAG